MSDKDNGGPAFPGGTYPEHPHHPNGMTLRDWFAGQALAAITAHMVTSPDEAAQIAFSAYRIADLMIEARK